MIRWLSDPVNLSYLIGAVLLLAGALVMLIVAFPGEKTQQQIVPQPWYSWAVVPASSDVPAPPNYSRRNPELDAVTAVLDMAEVNTVILEKFLGDQEEPDTEPESARRHRRTARHRRRDTAVLPAPTAAATAPRIVHPILDGQGHGAHQGDEAVSRAMIETTNAYWDAVRGHVNPTGSLWGTPEVDPYRTMPPRGGDYDRWARVTPQRHDHAARYSWTITDPATVAFVVEHSGGRLVDPMAGTGWWAHLLAAHGVDTVCSDIAPGSNQWHAGHALWVPVATAPADEAVASHGDRTLFLSWPPYDSPAGLDTLRAYTGDRAIVIHEGEGGCIGDDALFAELDAHWHEVADHVPVQWFGLHDRITVFDRAREVGE